MDENQFDVPKNEVPPQNVRRIKGDKKRKKKEAVKTMATVQSVEQDDATAEASAATTATSDTQFDTASAIGTPVEKKRYVL
ncbi:hypothetical protein Y032_0526g2943 [Ancylostoma ceylanicum]|nr:hypothetical protein Y032_0526g2943 [Ancylostoma ceylanicum]